MTPIHRSFSSRRLRRLRSPAWLIALGAAVLSLTAAPVEIAESALAGPGIAWFEPAADIRATQPSFALDVDLAAEAPIPADWTLRPAFFDDGQRRGVTIAMPPEVDLYATGEVTGPLLRDGQTIELWNTDNYEYTKADGRRLYQSHPWVLGLRPDGSAFGLLFDTTWRSTLETGEAEVVFETEGPLFRVVIIERTWPQGVMAALADLTGRMPLPPRWALGFHQCKYSYYPDARVREIADEFRARELPCDVIWMDIDYMDGFRVFTFDPEHFPDPAATNRYLHESGFKSIWMIDPGVKLDPGYDVYDTGTAADVWVQDAQHETFVGPVWPGDCVFPDYTMPHARAWWAGLYEDFIATGIDGVWNDMNEPAVFREDTGWTMPEDNWHRGGGDLAPGPHLRYHNVYGMLMVKASREGILAANPQKRPFVLTRANYLGGHRYAATWTGDNAATWHYLKLSVPMSLSLGLSGQPFNGPDIGGFSRNADPVLYGHWIALGAFYPFSRAHSDNESDDKEPWVFGPEIERVAQTALFRRYRLLPYLYTLMHEASVRGQPVMQPVFFADPADARLRTEEEAFLLGPDLLVVPRWAHDPQLPAGNWRTVRLLGGTREDDAYQPVLHLRPGAILPLGKVVHNTTEPSLDPLTLLVSLDAAGRARGTLYEDAGEGFAYREGAYSLSHYEATTENGVVSVRLRAREGRLAVEPRRVRVELVTDEGVRVAWGSLQDGVEVPLTSVPGGQN
ncbi:MAG: TIM-barrel domain-containing protein [Opitutales bacterium]